MTADDERILSFLVETDSTITPKGLAYSVPELTYYQAAQRLQTLRERGMAAYPEPIEGVKPGGAYRATELARRFVAGDITLKELRKLAED